MIATSDIHDAALVAYVVEMLRRGGEHLEAIDIDMRVSPYASSCRLYEVEVHGAGGTRELMLKDLSPSAQIPAAVGIRPQHLYEPVREIAVYRRILVPEGIGPRLAGASLVRKERRYLLLVERLGGSALDLIGDFDAWLRVSRWLGGMHRRFLRRPLDASQQRNLLRIDAEDFLFWLQRSRDHMVGEDNQRALAPIATRGQALADEFERLTASFIHGELYASNVIVDDAGGIHPIDWEMAAIGPCVLDIAALTAGSWSEVERAALIDEYAIGLSTSPAERYALSRSVDLARLYLALRLIGWSDDWTPPDDEQQDWLLEAVTTFERLVS